MSKGSNPATGAAMAGLAASSLIAAGAVSMAQGLWAAADAYADQVYLNRYEDALYKAVRFGRQMHAVAETAIGRVAELEQEVTRLQAACAQRQALIDTMRGRA